MQNNTVKLWSGLGVALVLGTTGAVVAADTAEAAPMHLETPAAPGTPVLLAAGGEGGEGGEAGHGHGGEAGAFEGMDEHAATVGQLLLVRGHLNMGMSLYEAGKADDALPHFLHPAEEIYESIEPELHEHQITALGDKLKALSEAVKAKADTAKVAELRKGVAADVAKAIEEVGGKGLSDKTFLYHVSLPVMQTVADEYEAAFRDGRIANVVEYQDSRGFVWALEDFLKARGLKDGDALLSAVQATKPAWPSVDAPEKPTMEPGAVLAEVSRIELMRGDYEKK